MDRLELQAAVVKKAMEDASFKEMLLKDPKGTVSKEFGITLEDGINVKAIEEDATTITLFVPASQSELSADELDHVAGGGCIAKVGKICGAKW